ncbi:MAG: hypothetical protein ACTSUO_00110 [Candidatus Thorarchaeota archaeon]
MFNEAYDEIERALVELNKEVAEYFPDPEEFYRTLHRVLTSSRFENIGEAMFADVIDVIPVLGDISNAMRIINARLEGDTGAFRRSFLQFVDFVGGILGPLGDVFDLITPTNIINYIADQFEVYAKR